MPFLRSLWKKGWVDEAGFSCLNLEVTRVIFAHSTLAKTIDMVPTYL